MVKVFLRHGTSNDCIGRLAVERSARRIERVCRLFCRIQRVGIRVNLLVGGGGRSTLRVMD